jgi:hypothetical protein
MTKISREVAEQEVNSWLDYKKVSERKRENHKEQIEILIDAIMEGALTLRSEDKFFVQTLKFPTSGEKPLTSLEYSPRIKMSTVHNKLQGVKGSDADGRVCSYVAALTSHTTALIKSLDSEDYSICEAVAVFFL